MRRVIDFPLKKKELFPSKKLTLGGDKKLRVLLIARTVSSSVFSSVCLARELEKNKLRKPQTKIKAKKWKKTHTKKKKRKMMVL